jgi:tartrate-resistant acid phosphatase type 5
VRQPGLSAVALLLALAGCRSGGGPRPPVTTPTPTPTIPPVAPVRFVAVGDTGSGNEDQFRVGRAMARKCRSEGCDFGVLLGDNFYPDGVASANDPQWQTKFEEPYVELLGAGLRFHAVLGNHDYADRDDAGRAAQQVERSRVDARFVMPALHYAFDRDTVRLVALDTQRLLLHEDSHAAQGQALAEASTHSGAGRPWVIALGHHPYLSNGPNGNAARPLTRFLEDVVCPRADLYLAAHDHNLQVLKSPQCGALLVIAGGGGYRTYGLPGGQPALFQTQTHGFAYVTATAAALRVEMLDGDGNSLFVHELTR